MGYSREKKLELYRALADMGYKEDFCEAVSGQLCTEWTAGRMLGYLKQAKNIKAEDIVDEMLAILEDRSRIMQKKEMEHYQGRMNEVYRYGLGPDE